MNDVARSIHRHYSVCVAVAFFSGFVLGALFAYVRLMW